MLKDKEDKIKTGDAVAGSVKSAATDDTYSVAQKEGAGCLYGIGVGPGDPELMTLKAVRILRQCPVIAIPHGSKEECTAYRIAQAAAPEIGEKPCLFLPMPMTKDRLRLESSHVAAAAAVAAVLADGKDVAFLTLGDVSVYSTYLYVKERVEALGCRAELVSGIPSFCAAAARLGISLVNGAEQLHVIPASYEVRDALGLPGVKVFMKSGRQISRVKALLKSGNYQVRMIENCGMEGERVFHSADEIPEDAGYYSLLIVREREEAER